jgi:hypothetical protein
MRLTPLVVAALPLLVGTVGAQTETRPTAKFETGGWYRAGGLHVGFPNGVSIALGTQRTVYQRDKGPIDVRKITFFMVGEPGLGATRLSAGWMYTGYNAGGVAFRISAMQQYYKEHATAIGPEISFMKFLFLGGRLGVFRRIAGNAPRVLAGFDLSFMH